jgi:hypothetical protein
MVNEISPAALGALTAATVPPPILQAIFGPALAHEKDLAERAARGYEVGRVGFDGEPPGYDDRKTLADVWQDHAPLPAEGLSSDVYAALVAVAAWGFERGVAQATP